MCPLSDPPCLGFPLVGPVDPIWNVYDVLNVAQAVLHLGLCEIIHFIGLIAHGSESPTDRAPYSGAQFRGEVVDVRSAIGHVVIP